MRNPNAFIEYTIHLYIERIYLPLVLVLGTIGNTITLIVLSKQKNRKFSTARLLLALAVTDLTWLWLIIPSRLLNSIYGIRLRNLSEIACRLDSFLVASVAQSSLLFMAVISLERFTCVLLPFKVKSIFTLRKTNMAIIGVPVGSAIFCAHFFYDTGLNESNTCVLNQEKSEIIFIKVLQISNVFGATFIPFIIIFVTNVCVIAKLAIGKCSSKSKHQKSHSMAIGLAVRKKTSQITVTLLLVILIFSICIVPSAVYYLLFRGERWLADETTHRGAVILLVWSLAEALPLTNCAANFIIYFLSASKFRKDIKALCCRKRNHSPA